MMKVRIQPASLTVPPDAPLPNDQLEREDTAELSTGLIGAIDEEHAIITSLSDDQI